MSQYTVHTHIYCLTYCLYIYPLPSSALSFRTCFFLVLLLVMYTHTTPSIFLPFYPASHSVPPSSPNNNTPLTPVIITHSQKYLLHSVHVPPHPYLFHVNTHTQSIALLLSSYVGGASSISRFTTIGMFIITAPIPLLPDLSTHSPFAHCRKYFVPTKYILSTKELFHIYPTVQCPFQSYSIITNN